MKPLNINPMHGYSKQDDPKFSKEFWKGLAIAVGAAMFTAISLVVMGLIAYYGQKYGF